MSEPSDRQSDSKAAIRHYEPSDRDAFITLNLDWIREHFAVEQSDRDQLEGLEATILAAGGQIIVAELDARVVGAGALVPPHHSPEDGWTWVEIIKMATAKRYRGRGVGRAVLDRLIVEARELNVDAIWLETNSILESAIRLYESSGFRHLAPDELWPTSYERCNVQMVLEL